MGDIIFKLLLLYVITIPVMKTPYLPFLAQRIQFSDMVFLILFSMWLGVLIKEKRLPKDTGLNKPFLVFIVFCLLSFFNSSCLFLSAVELAGLIYLFAMFILTADIVDSRKRLDAVIKVWIATLTAVLALGFIGFGATMITGEKNIFCGWVYHGNFPYLKDKTVYRMHSVFRNPLGLANYLLVSLGFVISEYLLAENKRYRAFLKILIFLVCLGMLMLLTRELSGLILILILTYSYFTRRRDARFRVIRFLSVLLLTGLFLSVFTFCSIFHIISYKIEGSSKDTHKEAVIRIDYAYEGRLAHKIAALEMIRRHPFLGVGLAMYPLYVEKLNKEDYFYSRSLVPIYYFSRGSGYFNYLIVNKPHNDLLEYLAETGIPGAAAFLFFIVLFLYMIFSGLKKTDDRYIKVRLFCLSASFLAVLVESIDLDVFKIRHLWFMMALAAALIAMGRRKAT